VGTGGKLVIYATQSGGWALRAQSPTGIVQTGVYYNLRIIDTGSSLRVELYNSDWSNRIYASAVLTVIREGRTSHHE